MLRDSKPVFEQAGQPTLVQTVALNYLAALILRHPLPLSNLLRWILQEEITYIRAIRYIPEEMKEKLPGEYKDALDTVCTDRKLSAVH